MKIDPTISRNGAVQRSRPVESTPRPDADGGAERIAFTGDLVALSAGSGLAARYEASAKPARDAMISRLAAEYLGEQYNVDASALSRTLLDRGFDIN